MVVDGVLHNPPDVPSVSVIMPSMHTVFGPLMAEGVGLMVTNFVAEHPATV